MAFADIYEVRDFQDIGGTNMLNVYHVQRDNAGVDAQQIGIAFNDTVLPELLPLQEANVDHSRIEVQSLDNPLDFAVVTPVPSSGTRVGANFAHFYAATLQFNRLRTDMKNGQKRFYVGIEADASGSLWGAAFILLLADLGDGILLPWRTVVDPLVPVCEFVILKRVCTVQPPPTPCPSYRLPENDAELVLYQPTTFTVRDTIRSQVSRKRLI